VIRKLTNLVFISGLLFTSFASQAQDRCGTIEYNKGLFPTDYKIKFENWVNSEISKRQGSRTSRTQAGPYSVPVVIHVIHNGEALGAGTNIPDAQILSQIKVLNADFNRLNSDASKTPATFAAIAGNMNIQFVLAKQDPEGLATTGIVRVNGGRSAWTSHDNYELKSKSYWPSEKYLNVWVCNITDYLGITQFPVSNLPGLENGSDNAETDGIIVSYSAFGSTADGNFVLEAQYNLGRTLTHEMGHFFGLNHIWGDDGGSCSGTDYVSDTPNQAGSTSGCPAHPAADNCTTAKMFQNYLDYTDDACMNLFTAGQVSRMSTVIENSPRRASLLTSPGLQNPTPVPNDLGISQIVSPEASSCSNTIVPQLEIKNYGTNQVVSTQLQVSANGAVVETKNVALNLSYLQTAIVSFNPVNVVSGSNQFDFEITQTNGVTDSNVHANNATIITVTPAFTSVPFTETFNSIPAKWIIENPDQQITWKIVTAPRDVADNKALEISFFDYEDSYGELDALVTPVMDFSSAPVASLMFDVAHATYQGSDDELKIIVLQNCQPLTAGTVVYEKAGTALSTAPPTTQSFTPKDQTQWRREIVNLSAYVGKQYIQLAFVGINDWGNNLYLDNISLFTTKLEDISLSRMKSPSLVTCEENVAPAIVVQNIGTVAITNFKINYSINGSTTQTFPVTDVNITSGAEVTISLPQLSLNEGSNSILINLTEPNGATDQTPANNIKTFPIVVNNSSDRIPLRENFDDDYTDKWVITNPVGTGKNWQEIKTNFNTSLYFPAFSNATVGAESWLVSPVLDFSNTTLASVVFDLSYALRGTRLEKLTLYSSTDCGNTFSLYTDISLSDFAANSASWTPKADTDWKKNIVVNLNALAGNENVRLAFVVSNQDGNNLYIDNIEFFTTDTPNTLEISDQFSIYGYDLESPDNTSLNIIFNLNQRQDVGYSVIDVMGKTIVSGTFSDVLNQTYPLELENNVSPGMYIVRLHMNDKYFAKKILISQ
jgi:hypothetical protein